MKKHETVWWRDYTQKIDGDDSGHQERKPQRYEPIIQWVNKIVTCTMSKRKLAYQSTDSGPLQALEHLMGGGSGQ